MRGWDGGKSKQRLCSQRPSALGCAGTAGVPFAGAQHHQHWPREAAAAAAGGPGTEHHHFHFLLLDVPLQLPACLHHRSLVSKGCHRTAPRVGGTDHRSLLSTPGDQKSKTEVPSRLALRRAVGENLSLIVGCLLLASAHVVFPLCLNHPFFLGHQSHWMSARPMSSF